jgi:hypothetical protein
MTAKRSLGRLGVAQRVVEEPEQVPPRCLQRAVGSHRA